MGNRPELTTVEKPKYNIQVPPGFRVVKNEFYQYNPELEYTEELNLQYLYEDLLQIKNEDHNIVIDLGWYGDIGSNEGQFKIYQIRNFDWDNPELEFVSQNSDEIYSKLLEVVNSIK